MNKKTKLHAEEWLKKNLPHLKIVEWGGGFSKKVRLLNAENNNEFFYCSVSELIKKFNKNPNTLFGATKNEKYKKQKESLKLVNYDFVNKNRENTVLQKYGVKNISQNKENRSLATLKIKQKIDQIIEKREKKCLEIYGVKNPTKTSEIKEKIKKTTLERYGVDSFSKLPEQRIENSKRVKLKCLNHFGENNPNWKGGKTDLSRAIRNLPKYKEVNLKVLKRDFYKCVECSSKKDLQVDHINSLKNIIKENKISNTEQAIKCSQLWDVNNLRTLCFGCHKLTLNWGAKKNG